MIVRHVAATVHGRSLFVERGGERLLAGFHGYAEDAERHLAELERLDAKEWSLLAIQALHPFYTRDGKVVATWMTSLDRVLAIADNVAYVRNSLASLDTPRTLVFLGFSQGAAMAARAAAAIRCDGLILLGGEVPPELKSGGQAILPVPPGNLSGGQALLPVPPGGRGNRDRQECLSSTPTLLARGIRDDWYTEEKFKDDLSFLQAVTSVTECVFDGGHEWSDAFRAAAADFLKALTR